MLPTYAFFKILIFDVLLGLRSFRSGNESFLFFPFFFFLVPAENRIVFLGGGKGFPTQVKRETGERMKISHETEGVIRNRGG